MNLALGSSSTGIMNTALGNLTIGGAISGAGSLVKQGNGTLTLSGNNTYAGTTTISAGTLEITSTGLLGGGNYSQAIANNGTFIFGSNSNQTLGGVISGAGALTKNGTGTLTLTNSANTYNGTTTINAGALAIGANMSIGAIAGSGNLSLGTGFTLTTNSSSSTALTGVISGGGGLTKAGTGALTLNGTNTYTGTTTLRDGTLNINSATALGTGTLTIAGGTIDNTSAAAITLSNNNVQNWNGDFSFNGTRDLNMGTGAVTMNASRTVAVNAGNITVGGVISGSSLGLTKNGNGTMILTGNNT
jgi:autotransporter-associated beta strand protein